MRALKTAQFTWILIGNGSHAYNTLWAPPGFILRFDLAHCKDFFRDRSCFIWMRRCL